MNPGSNPNPPEEPNRRSILPRSLDQGWATLLAALIALIGTITIVFYPRGDQPAPTTTPPPIVTQSPQLVTATITPTSPPSPTDLPAMTATPTLTLTSASSPTQFVVQPTAQLIGQSPQTDIVVQPVVASLMEAARALPLVMRDGFDTNDYAWAELKDIYAKGVECEFALRDSQYHIIATSTTTSGGAWCYSSAPRTANDFYLSFDVELSQQRIADVYFYYRYIDDNNFYYLILNPQTQKITLGVKQNGIDSYIIENLYVPAIHKNETNQLTLLALGDSQTLSINDSGVVLVSKAPGFGAGQIKLGLLLNEPDQVEELLLDNFELRSQ